MPSSWPVTTSTGTPNGQTAKRPNGQHADLGREVHPKFSRCYAVTWVSHAVTPRSADQSQCGALRYDRVTKRYRPVTNRYTLPSSRPVTTSTGTPSATRASSCAAWPTMPNPSKRPRFQAGHPCGHPGHPWAPWVPLECSSYSNATASIAVVEPPIKTGGRQLTTTGSGYREHAW